MSETDPFALAAALLSLLGEPVPHDTNLEGAAAAFRGCMQDDRSALLEVARLCGEPRTPQQLYLCTKLYSRLGRQYDAKTAQYAASYLASPGWEELPQGKVELRGIPIDRSAQSRAGVFADLGGACAGMGDYTGACSAYGKAYALEPYRIGYAVQLADALALAGRADEALKFLLEQKKSYYYRPVKYRGVTGAIRRDSTFRDTLDVRIAEMKKRLQDAAQSESRPK
jgi:tetratricopeptide (TPR) repeat protein